MKIASSVELGPGIRLAAPSRSRNLSDESHRRRRTISFSMIAMCAAGPPKAVKPSRRKSAASSARLARGLSPATVSSAIAMLPPLREPTDAERLGVEKLLLKGGRESGSILGCRRPRQLWWDRLQERLGQRRNLRRGPLLRQACARDVVLEQLSEFASLECGQLEAVRRSRLPGHLEATRDLDHDFAESWSLRLALRRPRLGG